jgi:hypothetical protein
MTRRIPGTVARDLHPLALVGLPAQKGRDVKIVHVLG